MVVRKLTKQLEFPTGNRTDLQMVTDAVYSHV